MAEHLDNLQFAARRVGADPLLAIRADLEVGWAYRLIELFGTMRRLDFAPGCRDARSSSAKASRKRASQ
ncbi:hypothetical protein [Mesorhizobium sp. WSM2239]|uniref:Uncharacterized protein n=2 Tax=unclassified Mesorhizobium TaxID=325217 RepID=A0AAU8D0P2_9HYPH